MESDAHIRLDGRQPRVLRWRLMLPIWVYALVAAVVYGILGEDLLRQGRRESAGRDANTHASHIAAHLRGIAGPDQLAKLERTLSDVLAGSEALAIGFYQPVAELPQLARMAVHSASDSTLVLFPVAIDRPSRWVDVERVTGNDGSDLWLATAVAMRGTEVIGVVRVATAARHAPGGLTSFWTWSLLVGAVLLAGLSYNAFHVARSIEHGVEDASERIEAILCGDYDAELQRTDCAELASLGQHLSELAQAVGQTDGSSRIEVETLSARLAERSRMLEQAYLEMQSLDRAKETFLSTLSHEMRTPLTSIIAAEEILSDYADEDRVSRHEFLQIIRQESRRLLTLISKLLDLAKLEAKALRLHLEDVEIGQLVEETTNQVFAQVRHKSVALSVRRLNDAVHCECDRERVSRMLHSLVENAFFYSPDNGQIRISVARDEGLAKITIEDDAANSCERSIDLFDHDVAPALDSSGSLLGDVVAQKLAKAHGGTLTRTSSASGGSLVVLCLPLTHADAPSIDYIATAGLDPDFP